MTPEDARQVWKLLLDGAEHNEPLDSHALRHLIDGVVIDIIEKRIELSDTFAVTIGNRINFIMNELIAKAVQP